MIHEVKYSGLSTVPDDYSVQDGELSLSHNLIGEDGAVRPIQSPKDIAHIPWGRPVLLHKMHDRTNLIVESDGDGGKVFQWLDWPVAAEPAKPSETIGSFFEVYDVKAVGTTLVFATDKGLMYFIWKGSSYISLGHSLPRLDAKIKINTVFFSSDNASDMSGLFGLDYISRLRFDEDGGLPGLTFKGAVQNNNTLRLDSEDLQKFTDKLFGVINPWMVDLEEKGWILFPVFVRFCYRLYDGTRVLHTPPQLILPNSYGFPLAYFTCNTADQTYGHIIMPGSKFTIQLPPLPKEWEDLVSSVDMLMTESMINYSADSADSFKYLHVPDGEDWAKFAMTQNGRRFLFCDPDNPESSTATSTNYTIPCHIYNHPQNGIVGNFHVVKQSEMKYLYAQNYGSLTRFSFAYKAEGDENYTHPEPMENPPAQFNLDETWVCYDLSTVPDGTTMAFTTDRTYDDGQQAFYIYCEREYEATESKNILVAEFQRADKKSYSQVVKDASKFFVVKSIPAADILTDKADAETGLVNIECEFENNELVNISTMPIASDEYRSNDTWIGDILHVYNSRLSFTPKSIKPFAGANFCNTFTPGYEYLPYDSENPIDLQRTQIESLRVLIVENNAPVVVTATDHSSQRYELNSLLYFYYPNPNAKKLYIRTKNEAEYVIDLVPHDFLNGAYAFNDFNPLHYGMNPVQNTSHDFDNCVEFIPQFSILQQSVVNNPFVFEAKNVVQVGSGEILGISSVTKALSEGQFGQFPLYVFCSDGVWALQISSVGEFESVTPVARDVITSRDTLLQLDNAVAFASNRGLMMIEGSKSYCISDALTEEFPELKSIPSLPSVLEQAGIDADKFAIDFRSYLDGAVMVYDYVHQRIMISKPELDYMFVFSLKSKKWATMNGKLSRSLNSYPEALAIDNNSNLVCFSDNSYKYPAGVLITRPLKLAQQNILKTVYSVIQRGAFVDGHVKCVLYGSRDLFHWHLVASSKDHLLNGFGGSPYKYFRIVCLTDFSKLESITGATFNFLPRYTNKSR